MTLKLANIKLAVEIEELETGNLWKRPFLFYVN